MAPRLHWTDAATLSLLEHVAGHGSELPLFIIGTCRDVELGGPLLSLVGFMRCSDPRA